MSNTYVLPEVREPNLTGTERLLRYSGAIFMVAGILWGGRTAIANSYDQTLPDQLQGPAPPAVVQQDGNEFAWEVGQGAVLLLGGLSLIAVSSRHRESRLNAGDSTESSSIIT